MSTLSREEIKQRLKALNDPWLSAAFAARIALLMLPTLSRDVEKGRDFLWFWTAERREEYLLKVLRAGQCAWSAARWKDRDIGHAARAAAAADADAAAAAYAAANAAAYAAYAADANAAYAANAANAANANAAAAYAYTDSTQIKAQDYIVFLEKNQSVIDFLTLSYDDLFQAEQTRFLRELRQLSTSGFDYWADWFEARWRGEDWDEQLARDSCLLSEEVLKLSPTEINARLKEIAAKTTRKLNRVRAIFIGDGAAGKTSLIRTVYNKPVTEGKEDMTPGVDIHHYAVSDILQADLWDFGGQVVAHATHQFFLRSSCVYVLLLCGRAEVEANQQAEYWLEHVRSFGDNAPVLLVGNKDDQEPVRLDLATLQVQYPNIVGFYPLSCVHCRAEPRYQRQFADFMEVFHAQLQQINTQQHHALLTADLKVIEAFEQRAKTDPVLPKSEYEALCEKQGVSQATGLGAESLLKLLDNLGIASSFPGLLCHAFRNTLVLDPHWLTYGVYALIYAQQTRQQGGRLSVANVEQMLGSKKVAFEPNKFIRFPAHFMYPADLCDFLLDAMVYFKLCYRLDRHQLIIPARLPEENKTALHSFDKRQALAYELAFTGFLPRHIMPGLIVMHHKEIISDTAGQRVWQNGVQLQSTSYQARALVTASYHLRRLSLWVSGADAVQYFYALRDHVLELKENMPQMDMQASVVLDDTYRVSERAFGDESISKIPLGLLRDYERMKLQHFPDGQGHWFDLDKVLGKYMSDEKQGHQTHVYVGGDADHVVVAGGNMENVVVGDHSQIEAAIADVQKQLDDLLYDVSLEADSEAQQRAQKELELAQQATQALSTPDSKEEGMKRLSQLGERLQKGATASHKLLEHLSDGGAKLGELGAKIGLLLGLV